MFCSVGLTLDLKLFQMAVYLRSFGFNRIPLKNLPVIFTQMFDKVHTSKIFLTKRWSLVISKSSALLAKTSSFVPMAMTMTMTRSIPTSWRSTPRTLW